MNDINLTQEELKLLSEWYWKEKVKDVSDCECIEFISGRTETLIPYKNSNDLDMLEGRMMYELKDTLFYYELYVGADEYVIRGYNFDRTEMFVNGYGHTKNEAILNAIIRYVKQIKNNNDTKDDWHDANLTSPSNKTRVLVKLKNGNEMIAWQEFGEWPDGLDIVSWKFIKE